ncbi:ATP-binding protein [Streptomyces platensis]|uniref:ATP-binding protein n=1 Tax=Streptomyces platensis TaxID=58346 RepID=UPI0038676530
MESRISGLVGREAETAEVRRLVEAAVAGAGQSAFIIGEAGLGKTSVLEDGMGSRPRPTPRKPGASPPLPGHGPTTAPCHTTSATPTAAKGCWTRTRTCSWKRRAATTRRPDP